MFRLLPDMRFLQFALAPAGAGVAAGSAAFAKHLQTKVLRRAWIRNSGGVGRLRCGVFSSITPVTPSLTLGGLVAFFVGQVALKLLNAALELRTLIAEIDSDLTCTCSIKG